MIRRLRRHAKRALVEAAWDDGGSRPPPHADEDTSVRDVSVSRPAVGYRTEVGFRRGAVPGCGRAATSEALMAGNRRVRRHPRAARSLLTGLAGLTAIAAPLGVFAFVASVSASDAPSTTPAAPPAPPASPPAPSPAAPPAFADPDAAGAAKAFAHDFEPGAAAAAPGAPSAPAGLLACGGAWTVVDTSHGAAKSHALRQGEPTRTWATCVFTGES